MTQLQIGVCLGFVLALIIWGIVSEIRIFLLEKQLRLAQEELKDEKINKPTKILDQSGIAGLLDSEYGPGKKD